MDKLKERALAYHSTPVPGKISVVATKPCITSDDLSLAYTPGVAKPVLEIADNPSAVWDYTSRGNLVAVVSNGTAILGLGDRGALASKPVMEGKGILFKRFADIDVFDIELDTKDSEKIIETVKLMEPTFGGINLEDIKGPECFYIERRLKEICSIPVFHDDQHGTAVISGAGLINYIEISGKRIEDIVVVFNGAGAAGISCAKFFIQLGVKKNNILMFNSKGLIHESNPRVNEQQREFLCPTHFASLAEAMAGADVFMGLSVKDCVTPDMIRSMAATPAVFAMANPDPEIEYELAVSARPDLIMATGRSDYPNQINNVLGFPCIFRGALDVRARSISDNMKLAAAKSLAMLAREEVPEEVSRAYGGASFSFGPHYIVPKPFDPRVIEWEAPAVARAACEEGLAQKAISDWDAYRLQLRKRMSKYTINN